MGRVPADPAICQVAALYKHSLTIRERQERKLALMPKRVEIRHFKNC